MFSIIGMTPGNYYANSMQSLYNITLYKTDLHITLSC